MTAKEMFEKLGYISLIKNYIKDKLKTIVYKNEVSKDWIKFYADKQQCKELGWLDE